MFGIFFLIVIPLCIFFYAKTIIYIAKKSSGPRKKLLFAIAFGFPITYPFLYLISPNYHEFKSLCSDNEYQLFKSIETDVFPAPYFIDGYKALIEKPYSSFTRYSTLYTPTKNWNSEQCLELCTISYKQTQCLENKCLVTKELTEDDQYIKYKSTHDSEDQRGIFNSLLRKSTETLVSEEHGVLAERYYYRFYPYGAGWAKILGAASGSAPSQGCESYSKFNYYEITPPAKGV